MQLSMQPKLVVNPLQWQGKQDDDLTIKDGETECLAEIRQVLSKYNNLERFGVAIIHSDFPLESDEVMLETTDTNKREHWIRPVKKGDIEHRNLEIQTTVLRFDDAGWCQYCSCARNINGHFGTHQG